MALLFYLIHIPLFAWVSWRWYRCDQEHPLCRFYWPALGVKLAAAVLIGILYNGVFNTTGDTYAYMIDGRMLNEIMQTDFSSFCRLYFLSESEVEKWQLITQQEPRYWNFFRLVYPLNLLCGLQYWIITFWLTFFCFIQLYQLSAAILKYYRLSKSGVLVALLLMPSVVYWSAGLNKETVAVAAIAYLVRLLMIYLHERRTPSWHSLLFSLCLIYLLWIVKFYYAAALLPCLLLWVILYINGTKKWIVFAATLLMLVLFFAVGNTHLVPSQFADSIYLNYAQTIQASAPESYFTLPSLKPELSAVLLNFPLALWYGCFTPLFGQAHYLLAYAAALQNTIVLFLFIVLLWKWESWTWSREATVIIIFTTALAGLLAIASPNWGSLLRYKVSFEPYALVLLLGTHPWMKQLDAWWFKQA